eukprot:CAMPEP_0118973456 /NCGR_PEP_ID=MMETSP1173-20130426/10160_1 /TAXON_ID=1034831 /ORGANISM="Rhizochromulina marina cf, Strain CCMP1243" /LENGTH=115 /DNA_ID=CAMNT_0006923113 /DNA_START=46 /DNA_END=394 /DNA_ORIENTATION=-
MDGVDTEKTSKHVQFKLFWQMKSRQDSQGPMPDAKSSGKDRRPSQPKVLAEQERDKEEEHARSRWATRVAWCFGSWSCSPLLPRMVERRTADGEREGGRAAETERQAAPGFTAAI